MAAKPTEPMVPPAPKALPSPLQVKVPEPTIQQQPAVPPMPEVNINWANFPFLMIDTVFQASIDIIELSYVVFS